MILLAAALVLEGSASAHAEAGFAPASGRPFDTGSAWNTPIPAGAALDARSAEIATTLSSAPGIANLYAYGVPVYEADATTPRYTITCTKAWGTCPFAGKQVPLPTGATPSSGTDRAMVVNDWSTNTVFEFYQFSWNSGSPVTGWGAVGPFSGSGRDRENGRIGNSTGAGVSRLAGVVRLWELQRGFIDHALVFSTKYCEAPTTNFRYPATKSDGKFTGLGSIPEGARIQLDPTINVDALTNITPAEKIVAKALQKYGAYAMDCGGANMAFIFETPSGEANTYSTVGLTADYFGMKGIPWQRISVLRQWDGCPCATTTTTTVAPTTTTVATTVLGDTTPPKAAFSYPGDGYRVGNSLTVYANATDNAAVVKMQMVIDGRVVATSSNGWIDYTWNTSSISPGAHTLYAYAYDAKGNGGTAKLTVYK